MSCFFAYCIVISQHCWGSPAHELFTGFTSSLLSLKVDANSATIPRGTHARFNKHKPYIGAAITPYWHNLSQILSFKNQLLIKHTWLFCFKLHQFASGYSTWHHYHWWHCNSLLNALIQGDLWINLGQNWPFEWNILPKLRLSWLSCYYEPPMQVITLFLAFHSLNFTDKWSYQCVSSGYIAGFRAEMYMKELIRQKMIKYRFGWAQG